MKGLLSKVGYFNKKKKKPKTQLYKTSIFLSNYNYCPMINTCWEKNQITYASIIMSYFIMVTPQLFDFSVSPIVYTVNYSTYYGLKAKTMLYTQIIFLLLK